jgi:N-acetylglucosaminyl-diphospho-decaprenol L-rhamnosyltransferase
VNGGPVRVVVVTYWPGDALPAFLDSLAAATTRETRVVLADNGSGDGAPEHAAETRPNVTLVRTGSNLGYGAAANVGVRALLRADDGADDRADAGPDDEEWLVVANPDITWHPGALDVLLDAAARWPRAAALGPAILTPQGDLYPSARGFPSLGRGVGHALFGWWWPRNPWTRAYRRESGGPVEAPAGWLSGSCLLLRRSAYDAVGGFDPAYFMYFEDLDLARRLAAAGWQSVYVPTAVVEHTGAHSTKRSRNAMLRAHHASAYRYLASVYRGPLWLPVRLALRLGLAARFAASLVVTGVGEGAKPTRPGTVLDREA